MGATQHVFPPETGRAGSARLGSPRRAAETKAPVRRVDGSARRLSAATPERIVQPGVFFFFFRGPGLDVRISVFFRSFHF